MIRLKFKIGRWYRIGMATMSLAMMVFLVGAADGLTILKTGFLFRLTGIYVPFFILFAYFFIRIVIGTQVVIKDKKITYSNNLLWFTTVELNQIYKVSEQIMTGRKFICLHTKKKIHKIEYQYSAFSKKELQAAIRHEKQKAPEENKALK